DDANNGTYCIGIDKIIYLNTNIDSTKTCTPLTATEEEADGKFYFTLSHTKMTTPSTTYYQCDVSGSDISNCEKKRAKLPECKTTNTTSSCRENDSSGNVCISSGKLYQTTGSSSCAALTGETGIIYITREFKVTTNVSNAEYVLRCSGGSTSDSLNPLTSCSYQSENVGGVIKSGSGPKMCITDDDVDALEVDGETSYKIVEVEGNNSFPGVSTKDKIMIKVTGNEGIVKIEEEKSNLPTCISTSKACKQSSTDNVDFCIKSGIIYKTKADTCVKITEEDADNNFIFFKRDYSKADPENNDEVYYAYQCTFNSAVTGNKPKEAINCTFVQGIVKTATKAVSCSGWKNDVCNVYHSGISCDKTVVGIKTDLTAMCFGSSEVQFPKDGVKYVAFTTFDLNSVFGEEEGKIVIVKMTPHSALKTTYEGEKEVFLIDQTNPENAEDKKPLIRCRPDTNPRCEAVASNTLNKLLGEGDAIKNPGKPTAYYVDGGYPFDNQIITCTQAIINNKGVVTPGRCSSAIPSFDILRDNTFFVDSGTPGNIITCDTLPNLLGYGDLPTFETTDISGKCIATAADGEYSVKEGVLYVTLSGNSCNKVITCRSSTSLFGLYSTGSSITGEKIIKCDGVERVSCDYLPDLTCKD
ncbi:hypothetical protein PIROE2DRAFT_19158, partial [Piromyces sp. E2]